MINYSKLLLQEVIATDIPWIPLVNLPTYDIAQTYYQGFIPNIDSTLGLQSIVNLQADQLYRSNSS